MLKFAESLKVWALGLALGLHMHGKRLQSPRETDSNVFAYTSHSYRVHGKIIIEIYKAVHVPWYFLLSSINSLL